MRKILMTTNAAIIVAAAPALPAPGGGGHGGGGGAGNAGGMGRSMGAGPPMSVPGQSGNPVGGARDIEANAVNSVAILPDSSKREPRMCAATKQP